MKIKTSSSGDNIPTLRLDKGGNMRRPTWISVLAILLFIGGLAALLLLISGEMTEAASILEVSNIRLNIQLILLGAIPICASIGMWKGKQWGWYLGAIYFCYAIVRNGYALIQLLEMADIIEVPEQGVNSYYIKYAGRIIVAGMILLYFFKVNVIEYFQMANLKDWKKAGIIFGITIIIFIGMYGPGLFQSDNNELAVIASIYQSGDIETALTRISKYLEKKPSESDAWSLKGDILYNLGESDESKRSYLQAVSLNSADYISLTAIGLIYREEGNYDKAREYYQKAVAFKPDYSVAYANMVLVELKSNDDRKALEYAQKAYLLDNTHPTYVANLAICHYYLGNFDEMDQYLKIAEEMGYHSMEALKQLCQGELTIKDH